MKVNAEFLVDETQWEEIKKIRKQLIKSAIDHYVADGWTFLDRKTCDDGTYFVMDSYGQIVLRYMEWDYEYSEWHDRNFWYPTFYRHGNLRDYSDLDDNLNGEFLLVTQSAIMPTVNTKKAEEMMELYWESYEERETPFLEYFYELPKGL